MPLRLCIHFHLSTEFVYTTRIYIYIYTERSSESIKRTFSNVRKKQRCPTAVKVNYLHLRNWNLFSFIIQSSYIVSFIFIWYTFYTIRFPAAFGIPSGQRKVIFLYFPAFESAVIIDNTNEIGAYNRHVMRNTTRVKIKPKNW